VTPTTPQPTTGFITSFVITGIPDLVQELYPGVRIGMVYTVHTGGRDLGFKPHVHPSTLLRAGLVMTKGGLKDGEWVEIDKLPGGRLAAKWRERIKQSFGYDPLECPRCGCIMQLAEIWEPKRGHIWIRRCPVPAVRFSTVLRLCGSCQSPLT